MDAVSNPAVQTVVLKCSAQVGKTEVINNTVGFYIDQDPSPILAILPTLELGEAWSKDRLAPMLRDTPCLKGKVKDPRARDSGNTLLHKVFPGGHITIAGANSPASLSSRPVRIVLCDEVDRYPHSAGTEGDPVGLAIKRSTTFWNRKSILCSTPTIEGASRIDAAYKASDQRQFLVPCPDCGAEQTLRWEQVRWDPGEPDTALYICEGCGSTWNDSRRWRAIRKGKWRATAPFRGTAGFHLNELYSPWVKLQDTAKAFLAAKDYPELLKVWVNTSLGETWAEAGEVPEWERLYERREDYRIGSVPPGVLFLTAGVDVQKDRLECQVIGWGRGKQNWSIDYIVLEGDTSAPPVWERLSDLLAQTYRHGAVDLPITRLAIDSGYATQEVYTWGRKHGTARVIVVKGHDRFGAAAVGQPTPQEVNYGGKKIARGIKVWPVAGNTLKSELYGWLRLAKPTDESGETYPPGFCHHPKYHEEFFKQLTAEKLVTRITRQGYRKPEWQKTRERNEALDTWIYARAAAIVVGIDRFSERHWSKLEADLGALSTASAPTASEPSPAPQQTPAPPPAPAAPVAPTRPRQQPGWLGDRRGWLKRW